MKIVLVLPPNLPKRCPLIGMAYLSACLKARNHEVYVFDLNAEIKNPHESEESAWATREFVDAFILENANLLESMAQKILETEAEIIGFSAWKTTKYVTLALAAMIKSRDRSRLVVLGGPECSFSTRELIANDAVDVLVYGEGEQTFLEVIEQYGKYKKISYCAGTAIKDSGNATDCGVRPEIENLNNIPFPDFSLFPLEKYYLSNTLPITFYRGCMKRCVFCNASVVWKKFRSRTAGNIFGEMIYQRNLFPHLKQFKVDDTALNLDLNVISKLCDLIMANCLKIDWGGSAIIHPDMGPSLLKKMAEAGCASLAYGLESGSQNVVDKMRKGFRVEDAQRLIRDTHHANIKVDLNVIIGFPNETEYDFQQTMRFIKRNREFISFVSFPSECWVGNQTYMHSHPDEFGLDRPEGNLWKSKDGMNTHDMRKERIRVFNDFVASLGLSLHNFATETGKIEFPKE